MGTETPTQIHLTTKRKKRRAPIKENGGINHLPVVHPPVRLIRPPTRHLTLQAQVTKRNITKINEEKQWKVTETPTQINLTTKRKNMKAIKQTKRGGIINMIVNAKITMANPLTIVVFDETEDKRRIDSMNHIEREKGATVM